MTSLYIVYLLRNGRTTPEINHKQQFSPLLNYNETNIEVVNLSITSSNTVLFFDGIHSFN